MAFPVTLKGVSYSESDFVGPAYSSKVRQFFTDCLSATNNVFSQSLNLTFSDPSFTVSLQGMRNACVGDFIGVSSWEYQLIGSEESLVHGDTLIGVITSLGAFTDDSSGGSRSVTFAKLVSTGSGGSYSYTVFTGTAGLLYSFTGDDGIQKGGTGATTASDALKNLRLGDSSVRTKELYEDFVGVCGNSVPESRGTLSSSMVYCQSTGSGRITFNDNLGSLVNMSGDTAGVAIMKVSSVGDTCKILLSDRPVTAPYNNKLLRFRIYLPIGNTASDKYEFRAGLNFSNSIVEDVIVGSCISFEYDIIRHYYSIGAGETSSYVTVAGVDVNSDYYGYWVDIEVKYTETSFVKPNVLITSESGAYKQTVISSLGTDPSHVGTPGVSLKKVSGSAEITAVVDYIHMCAPVTR